MTKLILILGIVAILILGVVGADQIAFADKDDDNDDHDEECKEDKEEDEDCEDKEKEDEDDEKENTLESKCAKKLEKKNLNLDGLFCLAIIAIQDVLDMVKADVEQLRMDLDDIELKPGPPGPPGPPGGGGGSGFPDTVPFTRYMFFEEFYWQDDSGQPLEDKYDELGGSGSIKPASDIRRAGGVIEIQSAPSSEAGRGEGLGLANKANPTGSWTDPTKNTESRIRAALLTPLTDRIDFIGFMDATPAAFGATTVALAEENFDNGAYFRSLDGGNWQAVTMNNKFKTETDTFVTPVAGAFQNFEILFTSDQVEFKINGSTVATHKTNVPSVLIFLQNYVASTIAANHSQLLDSWYIIGDR